MGASDDTVPLTLTRNEAGYLSDALSLHTPGPPDLETTGRPYKHLLLLIASALQELKDLTKCAEVTVYLSEAELWTIWEVSKTAVKYGTELVGYNLKLKSGAGLLALNSQVWRSIAVDVPIEEPFNKERVKAFLLKRVDQNLKRNATRRERRRRVKEAQQ